LQIPRGVVALTKSDLVDEEWLELVQEEIAELLGSTTLAGASIVAVSAHSGQGLPDLLMELERVLDESLVRKNIVRPRLPIDRVFSLTGFGTVVTGTLLDGNFKVGQEVEILPQGLRARVRNLQMHKQQIEVAQPGSRIAINLPNIARTDLARGNVVGLPDQLRPTLLCDAHISLLPDVARPLAHNTLVDFYCGSQEIPARVRLLDVEELPPGKHAWVQLRLSHPAVVVRRDRFILRIPSPSSTIGGGEVVDVQPRYHRRFQQPVLDRLERQMHGLPEELVLVTLDRTRSVGTKTASGLGSNEVGEIARQCNLAIDVTQMVLETLLIERRVCKIGECWFVQHVWDALADEALSLVSEYHRHYPLRCGLSKEEWRARLNLTPKLAAEIFHILQAEGRIEAVSAVETFLNRGAENTAHVGGLIRLPDFTPSFTSVQQQQIELLLRRFYESSETSEKVCTPLGWADAEAIVGSEVLNALIEQGQIVKLAGGILFLREKYTDAIVRLVGYVREHGSMTVSEARDLLGTTRKYIVPLLEHMDALRITRRQGDQRLLGSNVPNFI
ncbi:MAG TPA: SelB C-terminal domain-containing protein, partial [Ktedonobacteraceae bacterium]|nr:SelB C-terminal domain-containing protein [Ktedonobacteraceae bacterium]